MVQSAALGSSGFFPTLTFTVNDSFLHTKHSPHNATASRHIHLGLTQDYYGTGQQIQNSAFDEKTSTTRSAQFPKPDDSKSISNLSFFHLFNQFSFQGFLLFNLPDVPVLEISWVNRQMSEMFTFRQKGQVV